MAQEIAVRDRTRRRERLATLLERAEDLASLARFFSLPATRAIDGHRAKRNTRTRRRPGAALSRRRWRRGRAAGPPCASHVPAYRICLDAKPGGRRRRCPGGCRRRPGLAGKAPRP